MFTQILNIKCACSLDFLCWYIPKHFLKHYYFLKHFFYQYYKNRNWAWPFRAKYEMCRSPRTWRIGSQASKLCHWQHQGSGAFCHSLAGSGESLRAWTVKTQASHTPSMAGMLQIWDNVCTAPWAPRLLRSHIFWQWSPNCYLKDHGKFWPQNWEQVFFLGNVQLFGFRTSLTIKQWSQFPLQTVP